MKKTLHSIIFILCALMSSAFSNNFEYQAQNDIENVIYTKNSGSGMITANNGYSSSFNGSSVDGWKLNAGKLSNPGQNGSDGGGYLHIGAPGEGITSYLTAPSIFKGNWSEAKSISLYIWIGPGEYYTKRSGAVGDIILKNGSKTARYYFPQKPSTSSWRKIVIPLNSSNGWELDSGTRSLAEVLGNVTEFQIRAEYIIGDTETGIDEIEIIGLSNNEKTEVAESPVIGKTNSENASSFDGKTLDGWKLNVGKFSNPGQKGADGGGYLHVIAPGEGITSYLTSPSSYHGNWTGAKTLSLAIWIGPGEYYTKRSGAVGDIILKNGSKTARYYFPQKPPTSSWRKIVVPLNSSSGWEFDSGTRSLSEVLENVTEFQIRAEYIIGDTETGIDQISIDGTPSSMTSTSKVKNANNEPINIAGSWSSNGTTGPLGRLQIWQNGDEFTVIASWPDEVTGRWKSYKGDGRIEGREMHFKVFPSTTDGSSADQGYVYHYTISPDNSEIVTYYTRNGNRTVNTNVHYKLVKQIHSLEALAMNVQTDSLL